ncbi:MAG: Uma2 family endonuclease [Armatimonadota bacterium]
MTIQAERLQGMAEEWILLPRRKFTCEEYHRLAEIGILREDERVELIEGDIIQMVPVSPEHVTATLGLYEVVRRLFGKGYLVRIQSPLALGASEPEPDIAVVRGRLADYKHAHPTTAVLVIEVAQTSLQYDREVKASVYAKANIPEYWIVNLQSRRLEVYREPIESPDAPFGYTYRLRLLLNPEDTVAPLEKPDRSIRVARLFVV